MKKFIICLALVFSLISTAHARFLSGGSNSPVPPILDTVACSPTTDAAYGTVKLRSAYAGKAFQMRVFQSGVYVYQDIGFVGNVSDYASADTFAATADANTPAELRFYDQCGNSNDTTFPVTTGYKGAVWSPYTLATTTLRVGSFSLLYDNTTNNVFQQLVMPASMALNMDAFSTVFIGRTGNSYPARLNTFWQFNNTAPWSSYFYTYNADTGANILESNSTKLNYGPLETGPGVFTTIATASTLNLQANELVTPKTKATLSATANNGGTLGYTTNGNGNDGIQDIVAEIFYNHSLSTLEQSNVSTYGYSLLGQVENVNDCIVVIGDSLSQGYPDGYNNGYMNQAIHGAPTPISKPVRLYNDATNGALASTMLTNISRFTSSCANSSVTKKIAVVMGCTNDIGSGTTPAACLTTLETIWTDMHNAGFKVVCATIPNNNEGNSSNIGPLNALISANYAANNCDALADYWANANIGSGSNVNNTTYFYDGLHLTTVGYGIMAAILAPQINTVD